MKKYGVNELRQMFLDFMESKGHLVMKSFSLVPQGDKSLLLINAGMAPLKPYFTGAEIPPRTRVSTCQKCIRTGDIENVGKTARHGTFFEMLGNFSFGDYFKKEAIHWSWEFLTEVVGLDPDRLYPSVYQDDDEAFDKDRDELLTSLFSGDIGAVVNVGASLEGCIESVRLAEKYDNIYAAIGVHPDDYERLERGENPRNSVIDDSNIYGGSFMDWLKKEALTNNKVVAIGEIGLDYYYDEPGRELQKKWFARQLELAREVSKPVIIHSRDACADTIDILKSGHASEVGGIIHCYSYSKETVKTFYDMNFYFGIGGVLTFKNAKKLIEAANVIPLERIVLETDCPYLAPVPNRGKRNDSSNIQYVIEKLADIKGVTKEQIAEVTYQNACRVYGLHL